MSVPQTIIFIIGCIVIIFAAYFTTVLIGRKSMGQASGRAIKLRDRAVLGKDQSVVMVEVSGRAYVVAMTSHAAALLDVIPADELAAVPEPRRDVVAGTTSLLAKGIAKGIDAIKQRSAAESHAAAAHAAAAREAFDLAAEAARRDAQADPRADAHADSRAADTRGAVDPIGVADIIDAANEDDIDRVFREIQLRRENRRQSLNQEDKQ